MGGVANEVTLRCAHVEIAIGEVGATTARDADLFGDALAVVEQQDPESALSCDASAKQAGCASANDDDVESRRRQRVVAPSAVIVGGGLYLRWPM